MATSKHLAIRAAIAALFTSGTPIAQTVHQNRDFALPADKSTQAHVNLSEPKPVDAVVYTGSPRDWSTQYELVILARKTGGIEASDVADAIWVDAYGRLMGDQTLGGLLIDVEPGEGTSEPDEADTSLCRFTWRFTCKHRTENNSISS